MKRTKKMLALVLATSMVMGSSLVAFAADTGSASVSGNGIVEGHVDKEVLEVILPTVPANRSAFEYTMDPERLIQDTDAGKYEEGTVFPDKENDTGVYFLRADNTYANTSETYQVVNKSSCNVSLKVEFKTEQNTAKDITLANDSTVSTSNLAQLYLGMKVGDTTTTLTNADQNITKVIAGSPDNFSVAVKDGNYVYQPKSGASVWKAMNVSMAGAVGKADIASDTTAPVVRVTWSYEKAASGVSPDTDAVETAGGPQITFDSNGLISVAGLTADKNYVSVKVLVGQTLWDINDEVVDWHIENWSQENGGSFTIQMSNRWIDFINSNGGKAKAIINYTNGSAESAEITF